MDDASTHASYALKAFIAAHKTLLVECDAPSADEDPLRAGALCSSTALLSVRGDHLQVLNDDVLRRLLEHPHSSLWYAYNGSTTSMNGKKPQQPQSRRNSAAAALQRWRSRSAAADAQYHCRGRRATTAPQAGPLRFCTRPTWNVDAIF